MGRTRIRYHCARGCVILNWRTSLETLPLVPPFCTSRRQEGAILLHKAITASQMEPSVCGLTAAPCPRAYEHRQSCPGVTQAVSYDPRFLHGTLNWSRLAGSRRSLATPFSTQVPDLSVPSTFVQPVDCLMPNPNHRSDWLVPFLPRPQKNY